ncbi:hypothetical protein Aph02nite_47240 [Actinoplanes philippinensis]|uniref:Uncharacterized protein n=1 Tax=Actinoplanes philippinensis TaxID=35752 RepID=A0A1I2I075_9ACTN|nr:hypothetical protein [Actinoplanes philippinensis]GIE78774.1 hypothetical protein Aph02nite_47240 [Actinoplanes philippinensis]SFF35652.1 hypothetical protein SAMN05421541_109163 [Actinoplanes philippinensis]
MSTTDEEADDMLVGELAAAMRESGHLTERVRAAGAVWTWRGIDEELELAGLTYDSLIDAGASVRSGTAGNRTVLFTGESAEVQVERDAEQLIGQLIPPGPGRLTAEGAQGPTAEAQIDEVGCFSVDVPVGEPFRLRVEAGPVRLRTDWIRM